MLHTTKMKPVRGNQHDANNDDKQEELFYNLDSIVASTTNRQKGEILYALDKTRLILGKLSKTYAMQAVRDYHTAHPRVV